MKVRDLMERIRLREIVLPEFQREYVWDVEQARQLLVSLYRNYPTGSLLFWDTTTPPAIKQQTEDQQIQRGAQQVILDGQQRLTALYLLTQGQVPPYYTDAEIMHDPRSIYFDLATGGFHHAQHTQSLLRSWVLVTDCFQERVDPSAVVDQLAMPNNNDAAAQLLQRLYSNRQQLLNILELDYPDQTVPVTASLGDAIDVFDRVNSSGTKLTAADLALTHITGKWQEARPVMKAKLAELKTRGFHLDLDFMVRGLVGVVNGRARFDTIHHTPAPSLVEGWQRLIAALDCAVTILAQHATIRSTDDLPSPHVLIPLTVHIARRGGTFPNDAALRRALHWLYIASMWSRYSSETDQRLDHDLSIVQRNIDPWSELEDVIIEQRGRIEVRSSDIEGRGPEHPLYQIARVVMVAQGALDWVTGMPLTTARTISAYPIFPASLLMTEGAAVGDDHIQHKRLEEIANHVFLATMPPAPLVAHLSAINAKNSDALILHTIPLDPQLWQPAQFVAFLNERRKLIADAINAHMRWFLAAGVPVQPRTLTDLLNAGESASLEYKSTMLWDVDNGGLNRDLEHAVTKTVAAFLNAQGGILLIGVDDSGQVYGIERDLEYVDGSDEDGYQRRLREIIRRDLGQEYTNLIRAGCILTESGTICAVRVRPSPKPVFFNKKNKKADQYETIFYVRDGNATNMLTTAELNKYLNFHWNF